MTTEEKLAEEQWSRIKPLSRKEMAERQKKFTAFQAEYNKTHNPLILWQNIYPLIVDAVKSNTLKLHKHHFVNKFEQKVDDAVDLLMKRYIKKPNYNYKSLVTLCYWAVVWANRREDIIHEDMEKSYEFLVDEMMLHEEEHIIDFQAYENVDDLY